MSKRSEIRVALEKFLRTGEAKGASVVRDHRRRPVLIPDAMIDYDRIGKSGRPFMEMGRRLRILKDGVKGGEEAWVFPSELCQISRDEPAAAGGITLPFGTIVNDHGLWLRFAPGYKELGVNDRNDVLVVYDPEAAADPAMGPVPNAVNTALTGIVRRLVARTSAAEHAEDRREAEAWFKALALVGGSKPLKADFKSAGIDGVQIGNSAHLQRCARLGFYEVRDTEMLRLESLIRLRFRKARRQVPHFTILTLTGVPRDQASWGAFQKKLKAAKKEPAKLGIPEKLVDSRFYDPASKAIVPTVFVHLPPLAKSPNELSILLVNAEIHSEVKIRGVLAAVTTAMAHIEVIASRSSVAVLNKAGTATCLTGPSGTGKSVASLFWAGRDERLRRSELRRRYDMDLRRTPDAGRLGEVGIQKELDRTMDAVGILCQEEGALILKEGAGRWMFWPAFRAVYARMAGFPGKRYVLSENKPLLENASADFGGSGDPEGIGQINHECYGERIFYEPEWKHLSYDRTPRMISAHVLVDRNVEQPLLVRRVSAREAVDWLLQGKTPDGRFEPLCNIGADFAGILAQLGTVGEKLTAAYESGQRGDHTLLGAGDAVLGEAIFERLDLQVKLWLDTCREVPTFIVNGAAGVEIAQDAHWLLSEHPELFGGWHAVAVEEFRKYMLERYGVSYGPRGEWTHPASRELATRRTNP